MSPTEVSSSSDLSNQCERRPHHPVPDNHRASLNFRNSEESESSSESDSSCGSEVGEEEDSTGEITTDLPLEMSNRRIGAGRRAPKSTSTVTANTS